MLESGLQNLLESGPPDTEVAAIVRLGPGSDLPRFARVVSQFGNIATIRLPRSRIPTVRYHENVIDMIAPGLLHPEVQAAWWRDGAAGRSSIPAEASPKFDGPTGKGVVVGVIDWGLDFAHPDFRNGDGTTRLLAL